MDGARAPDGAAVLERLDVQPHELVLLEHKPQVPGVEAPHRHGISAQSAHRDERARLDAVAHHAMALNRVKRLHALDLDDGRPSSVYLRAHLVQQVRKVHDLGLACRIVDDGRSLGAHGRHHEVLRRTDAREVERDGRARDSVRRGGVDVAVVNLEVHAQGLEPQYVHVDLARADVAAARHGHHGLAKPGEQGTHHGR